MNKKVRRKGEASKLEMTSMIDVVFLLLIFFIVTLKQEDILAHLDVNRPEPQPERIEVPPQLVTIVVYNQELRGGNGYEMEGRRKRPANRRKNA